MGCGNIRHVSSVRQFPWTVGFFVILLGLITLGIIAIPAGGSEPMLANSVTKIDDCTTIDEPGTYEIVEDITTDQHTCIKISDTEGVTIDGNSHSISGSNRPVYIVDSQNILITDLSLDTIDWIGIHVQTSQNVNLKRINITSEHINGVEIIDSSDIAIDEIRVNGATGGIHVSDSIAIEVTNTTIDEALSVGIYFDNSSSITIENNTVLKAEIASIRVGGLSTDAVVKNNEINNSVPGVNSNNSVGSIILWEASDVTVEGNSIDGHRYGIQIKPNTSDVVVRDNEVVNSVLCAMDVKMSSRNILIENNYFANHSGIAVENRSSNVTIRNNIIKDGRAKLIEDGHGVQFRASVHVWDRSHDVEIYNNTIVNSTQIGVEVSGIDANVFDISVRDNIIKRTEGPGVLVRSNASDVEVLNNVILESSRDGVHVSDSEDVLIRGNKLTRINETGVDVEESSDIRIHHNDFSQIGEGVRADDNSRTVNATHNWWGAASGPSGQGSGTGASVTRNVEFDPWLAPEATLQETRLSETELSSGDTLTITAAVENTGTFDGIVTIELAIDGEIAQTSTRELAVGENTDVRFDQQFDAPGDYRIALNDVEVGTVAVRSETATTPDVTPTAGPSPTLTTTPGQSGFGFAVTLVVLVGAILLVSRDHD